MKIWQCKIGESVSVPNGADAPMREAVARAYKELTGEEPTFIFSGWGAELTEPERAVVENRLPTQPAASAEPAVWVAADTLYSAHPMCVSSLAYMSQADHDRGREYVPLAIINHHAAPVAQEPVSVTERWQDGDDSNMVSRVDTTAPVAANAEPETVGRTTKEAWWAGYRAGKGVPADMHRQAAVQAAMRCPRCGEGADVSISSAQMVTHRPDGAARDERDIASDPEGKMIHDPSEPLLAAPVAAQAQHAISGYTHTVPDDCETLHWRGNILSMNELASVAQPAVGEEIHIHIEGQDVLTLPLASSGMDAPRFVVHVPAQAQPAMPPLTEAMRAVLRNEHCVYDSEDTLYAALCNAAGPAPSDQDREDDEALADTQRAIIEAAERRGYARAEAENVGYRTDAGRYREFFDAGLPITFLGIDYHDKPSLDAAIDAARAASSREDQHQ